MLNYMLINFYILLNGVYIYNPETSIIFKEDVIMTSRYIPKVGDVVDYNGKRMVLIKTEIFSCMGDYRAYLIEEDILRKSDSLFIETEELGSKCTILRYDLFSPPSIPFVKIDSIPIEVKSFTRINLKE